MKADLPSERRFWFEPTVPRRPIGTAPQAARRHLPHRPATRLRCRPRGGDDSRRTSSRASRRWSAIRLSRSTGSRSTRFQCRRLERFVHGRVIFVGDSAHIVSPFGARGGNGGIQDVDNLGWKLAAVLKAGARGADRELQRRAHPRRRREHRQLRRAPPASCRRRIGDGEDVARRGARSRRRHCRSRASWSIRAACRVPMLAGRAAASDADRRTQCWNRGRPARMRRSKAKADDVWPLNQLGDGFTRRLWARRRAST